MRLITVVPQKNAISAAKPETFFGILLAVFVGMRTVYKEKNRTAKFAKIHQCGVPEMLFDSGLHGKTLEFTANRPSLNQVKIILGHILDGVFRFGKIRRQIHRVYD